MKQYPRNHARSAESKQAAAPHRVFFVLLCRLCGLCGRMSFAWPRDPYALSLLYDRCGGLVFAIGHRMLGDNGEPEELVIDVLWKSGDDVGETMRRELAD